MVILYTEYSKIVSSKPIPIISISPLFTLATTFLISKLNDKENLEINWEIYQIIKLLEKILQIMSLLCYNSLKNSLHQSYEKRKVALKCLLVDKPNRNLTIKSSTGTPIQQLIECLDQCNWIVENILKNAKLSSNFGKKSEK